MPNRPSHGWSGKRNGELLALADPEFDVLVTADQGLEFQQNLARLRISVRVLVAPSNQVEDLVPLLPASLAALSKIEPGSVVEVGR
jgi:hypothetical protein